MKNPVIIFILVVAALISGCRDSSIDKSQMVNPLLGDISYERKFGHKPDETTDNNLRIRTHLEYAESLLRNKDLSHLSAELKLRRNHLLNLLHDYWTNGVFPKNYDYADQRKPCFIDKDGTICAVGYLVEQTTGRKTADKINSEHKYDEVLAMNDQTVDNWILTSGLTKEECAMIQPTYGPAIIASPNHITPSYGISSSVIGGINLSLSTVNLVQISKGARNKTVPIIGLITGAGQIVLGSSTFPKDENSYNGSPYSGNESQKTLSMLNIGLGTTTMILSAWNLITNHKRKEKLTAWNIYSFPAHGNNTGIAVSFTRHF